MFRSLDSVLELEDALWLEILPVCYWCSAGTDGSREAQKNCRSVFYDETGKECKAVEVQIQQLEHENPAKTGRTATIWEEDGYPDVQAFTAT